MTFFEMQAIKQYKFPHEKSPYAEGPKTYCKQCGYKYSTYREEAPFRKKDGT
jgi:hypothetical protein